jgi:predicted lipoprotein with Yx(FWY)xxD motif
MGLRVLKTRLVAVAVAAVFCVVVVAASGAPATVQAWHSSALGSEIVVNATGRTLYVDGKGAIRCAGVCVNLWPPLVVAKGVKPVAGKGLKASLVGTVKRPNGTFQVTYGGYALYRYNGDSKSGQLNGQGLDDIWHVIGSNGTVVTTSLSSSAGAVSSGSSSSGSSGSSSGSSGYSTGSSGSTGGSSGSTGSGSSGSSGGTTTSSECETNPGADGCM